MSTNNDTQIRDLESRLTMLAGENARLASELRTKAPKPRGRNYCSLGDFYAPDGPPIVRIQEDPQGPLLRTNPFGHHGPHLVMTIDFWNTYKAAVDKALAERSATRVAVAL